MDGAATGIGSGGYLEGARGGHAARACMRLYRAVLSTYTRGVGRRIFVNDSTMCRILFYNA